MTQKCPGSLQLVKSIKLYKKKVPLKCIISNDQQVTRKIWHNLLYHVTEKLQAHKYAVSQWSFRLVSKQWDDSGQNAQPSKKFTNQWKKGYRQSDSHPRSGSSRKCWSCLSKFLLRITKKRYTKDVSVVNMCLTSWERNEKQNILNQYTGSSLIFCATVPK